jgi:NAD-dependent DNA ligase
LTRCINISCPAILPSTIRHWWAWKGAGISDLSDEHINLLIGSGKIQSVADLYNINCTKFQEILSVEESFAHRLVEALEESKTKSLSEIIYGLKIRYVGLSTARKLAQRFLTLEELAESDLAEIENVEGIHLQATKFIYQWFHNPANQELLRQLKAIGLKPSVPTNVPDNKGWIPPVADLIHKFQELKTWVEKVIAELQKLISSNREELAKIRQDNEKSQAKVLSQLEQISNLLKDSRNAPSVEEFITLVNAQSTKISDIHSLLLGVLRTETDSTQSQKIYRLLGELPEQFSQFANTQGEVVLRLQTQLEQAQSDKENLLARNHNLQGMYAVLQLEHSKYEIKLNSIERENQQITSQLEQNMLEKAQLFSLLEQINKDNSHHILALEQITAHRDALQQELLDCQSRSMDSKRWRLLLLSASKKQQKVSALLDLRGKVYNKVHFEGVASL